jgi:hypothetical protein
MSGALEASTSVSVVPRPARPIRVRPRVAAKSEWVTLSKEWKGELNFEALSFEL